jgi:putative aldouronate transport system substrate-binding protein
MTKGCISLKGKRKISILMLAVLILTMLAACTQNKNGNDGNAATPPSESGANSSSPAEDGKPVTVNLFVGTSSTNGNLDTNWFTEYAEKTFSLDIKWSTVPNTDVATKQPLLLASGDYPSIFWAGQFNNEDLLKYGQQGVFEPLNDLLKEHAPNVWNAIENTPALKQGVYAPDGNIYGLPFYNYCLHCYYSSKLWVYEPFLEERGLDIPTSTEEFERMLEAFKADGILPLTGSTDGWNSDPTTFLMNAFVYNDGGNRLTVNDGKLGFAAITDEWKEGLKYINGLYSKGLISSAAFTQTNDVLSKQAINHEVGVVPWGCMNCVVGADNMSDIVNWVTIPPLKGPNGAQYAAFSGNGVSGAVFAITNKASNEEKIAIMKLLDFIWTPEGTTMANYGPEGEYWTKAKEGETGLVGTPALFDINFQPPTPFTWGWNQLGPIFQSDEWRNGVVAKSPFSPDGTGSEALLHYYTEKDYKGKQPDQVVPASIWIDPGKSQEYSLLKTNITTFVNQWTAEFIVGNKSIDKDWNAYVEGVQKLGLADFLSITEEAMVIPFDTSSYQRDDAVVRNLESLQ